MKKADDNDWLVITGLNGKEIPGLKDALLRKLAREDQAAKQPAKAASKKKEAKR
jgi:hypothetical protein